MQVSDELASMNADVQSVYKDIINNDGTVMKIAKSIPIISSLAKSLDAKWDEAKFNIKSMEGKIEAIFSGFDQA
jgi:peptidoglycan hydrolase CwlO-like protein